MTVIRPYLWQIDQRDGRTLTASGELKVLSGKTNFNVVFNVNQISRTLK